MPRRPGHKLLAVQHHGHLQPDPVQHSADCPVLLRLPRGLPLAVLGHRLQLHLLPHHRLHGHRIPTVQVVAQELAVHIRQYFPAPDFFLLPDVGPVPDDLRTGPVLVGNRVLPRGHLRLVRGGRGLVRDRQLLEQYPVPVHQLHLPVHDAGLLYLQALAQVVLHQPALRPDPGAGAGLLHCPDWPALGKAGLHGN